MPESKPRDYESLIPGLQLTAKNLRHNISFAASAPGPDRRGYYTTADPKIQKIIEVHPRFKDGTIRRVPSPEEIEEMKKQEEQKKRLENLNEFFAAVGGIPDFNQMKEAQLYKVADLIGIEVETKSGGKKAKSTLVNEIEKAIGK